MSTGKRRTEIFSARLASKLESNDAHMITEISTQVHAEFLSAFQENIMRQSTEPLKPLSAADPMNLIVHPSEEKSEFQKGAPIPQPPPKPSK